MVVLGEMRPSRLPDVVARQIEEHVFAQNLVDGDQLPTEAQLSAQYDVSRTVVREATRILEQRGLVTIRPGRGMLVAKPDGGPVARQYALLLRSNPVAFDQLMDTRLLVEVHLTGLAAENRTVEDVAAMRSGLTAARANRQDYDLCLTEDLRLHALVGQASGNPLMSLFVDPVNQCLRESYRSKASYLSRLDSTLEEHEHIVDAIAAGDAESARDASRRHLERVKAAGTR
ncbi:FadR/GntR family transcriptional regulator [Angustibacter sp. McL0619]|uniref:FadR/GntR family transcriptional regulator n=1 Tax=Angustibacter sp. McL0619 TaxID=3415676 RepID=UPI003CF1118A